MWLSLIGALLCVFVMFLISWATALLTFGCVLTLYLIVAYRKPDVNWGSSTQAQTYKTALNSVQQLNNVEDHIKNYRPQILVFSGFPNTRPILVDFAYSLTKNVSLLLCGHIIKGATNHKHQSYLQRRARDWFGIHKLKAFYSQVDDESFESGCKALMQASGIGKLKPNIVLMGYKHDWRTCDKDDLQMYFNVVHKVSGGGFRTGDEIIVAISFRPLTCTIPWEFYGSLRDLIIQPFWEMICPSHIWKLHDQLYPRTVQRI